MPINADTMKVVSSNFNIYPRYKNVLCMYVCVGEERERQRERGGGKELFFCVCILKLIPT